ncbi:MAG: hypothetical protein G01um101418_482 [Parcubacteria group bacterium Gr01-1014_18]|nr:MAG: hypothetical protein Greene041636_528 [Parcubacteria group bacterium Greene0416_36]TSC81069.1 MAG: hypothetical protein G01um101418_482 [Parcubacteria group bacterium Gr01-1014_18]TSC98803.1 MAG: hypothetical protein Greene101420_553 [Parcubacteria group bacterium Greene1014_20]TSD06717.1 MAG: hypothetical protein Greene07142_638 [Parcubacteria group bacterium Greene0714_2]
MSKIFTFLLISFLWLISVLPSLAQEESAESKKTIVEAIPVSAKDFLSEPVIGADSVLYGAKRVWEWLGDVVTVDNISQATRDIRLAKKRLDEINALLSDNNIEEAKDLVRDYNQRVDAAGEVVETIKDTEKWKNLSHDFADFVSRGRVYLGKVMENLPVAQQSEFREGVYTTDKWELVSRQIGMVLAEKLGQVGDNLGRVGEIGREVEEELLTTTSLTP